MRNVFLFFGIFFNFSVGWGKGGEYFLACFLKKGVPFLSTTRGCGSSFQPDFKKGEIIFKNILFS